MRFLVSALLVVSITYATQVCEPDSTKQEGSSICFCLGSGRGWICTYGSAAQPLLRDPRLRDPPKSKEVTDTCEPGTHFRYYCNFCTCGVGARAGHFLCTKRYCDPATWNKDGSLKHPDGITGNPLLRDSTEIEEVDDTCEPGKRFKYYCNSCFCGAEGKVSLSACTKMHCDPELFNKDGSAKPFFGTGGSPLLREVRENKENEDTCEPGKPFQYYCNSCTCRDNGKVADSACTDMYCDPEFWNKDGSVKHPKGIASSLLPRYQLVVPKICEPGKTFKIDCNYCRCSEDGLDAACTKMECPPSNELRNGQSKPVAVASTFCKPNTTFKKDCNTCRCNEDGSNAACTLIECL